jgi:hypothetical protein
LNSGGTPNAAVFNSGGSGKYGGGYGSSSSGAGGATGSIRDRGYWMSTGLVPHFLMITFYEKWVIRKVILFKISAMSIR